MIEPGAMLGILGGGQLGRMFVMAAQSIGYAVTVLDPIEDSPAGRIAERHLCADYLDVTALNELGSTCAGVTTEFENVPADALRHLSRYCPVSPDANSISIAQDRIREKQFLTRHGFALAPYLIFDYQQPPTATIDSALFPGILKRSRFGYDGKGQIAVDSAGELHNALISTDNEHCVLEKRVPLTREISVIISRGHDRRITFFPVAENRHANGILDVSIIPATIAEPVARQACEIARQVAVQLDYTGILCVEFFMLDNHQLLINEIAPRPHNSGHFSLDACITSQFEQQVRILCSLPPGGTSLLRPAVMVNLLGDLWKNNFPPDWRLILDHPDTKLHLYGKQEARPGRKMGHFTVLADTTDKALTLALDIKQALASRHSAEPGPTQAIS
ncbi:MAG: 5-(carboxyamino)imidazole ribonucleotide synthase [Nitrosomonas sp.]|nr:5-(carboxyamino)imidazole ribonucleotide synthase [Nitrosomonas sp.]